MPRRLSRHRHWLLAAAAVVVVAALVLVLDVGVLRRRVAPGIGGLTRSVRLTVLPFENLSGDPEQEYLSDGVTQEMIAQLGRLHPQSLSVIARTSVMLLQEDPDTSLPRPQTNLRAWEADQALLADDRIAFRSEEPPGLEALRRRFAVRETASPRLWMDAYLAALALAGGHRMVTTDAAFKRFGGLDLKLLGGRD